MAFTVFGNGSDIVRWEPNPQRRGTFDVLSVCVITLLLCVWTAVHLNIPRKGEFWSHIRRKILWLFLGLIAPELVAYTAWYQRRLARDLMRSHNEAFELSNPSSWTTQLHKNFQKMAQKLKFHKIDPKRSNTIALEEQRSDNNVASGTYRYPWTMIHGFYVAMGGFTYDIPIQSPEKTFIPDQKHEIWTISPQGLLYLLANPNRRRDIPNIPESDIIAKSRATIFAKSIVCLQALWFCIQCITRVAQGLPISLLELNTFGHSVCALLIYCLWWNKPFDVEDTSSILSESLIPVRALQWMNKNATEQSEKMRSHLLNVSKVKDRSQEGNLHFYLPSTELQLMVRSRDASEREVPAIHTTDLRPRDDAGDLLDTVILQPGEALSGTGFRTLPNLSQARDTHWETMNLVKAYHWTTEIGDAIGWYTLTSWKAVHVKFAEEQPVHIELDSTAVVRWRLAWQTVPEDEYLGGYVLKLPLDVLCDRIADWPHLLVGSRTHRFVNTLGFLLASLLYGGLHALAWNAIFATATEQILWRISSCCIIGGGVFFFVFIILFYNPYSKFWWPSFTRPPYMRLRHVLWRCLFQRFFYILLYPVLFVYIAARIYLVVESFINLSHMPSGVYQVPNWSTYFPHIS